MKTSTRNKGRNTPPTKKRWLMQRFTLIAHQARLLVTEDALLDEWERREKAAIVDLWTVPQVLEFINNK